MIKNEKQYKISKRRLAGITAGIEKVAGSTEANDLKKELILISFEDLKTGIEKEIAAYNSLKSGKSTKLKERSKLQVFKTW